MNILTECRLDVKPDDCEIALFHTQRRVQSDQCYFTVQMTGINFEYSL